MRVQIAEELAPTTVTTVPGVRAVLFKELELYVPWLQQVQALEALAVEMVPLAQGRQAAVGITSKQDVVLYVPEGHKACIPAALSC